MVGYPSSRCVQDTNSLLVERLAHNDVEISIRYYVSSFTETSQLPMKWQ
jgi:hypothetical protein